MSVLSVRIPFAHHCAAMVRVLARLCALAWWAGAYARMRVAQASCLSGPSWDDLAAIVNCTSAAAQRACLEEAGAHHNATHWACDATILEQWRTCNATWEEIRASTPSAPEVPCANLLPVGSAPQVCNMSFGSWLSSACTGPCPTEEPLVDLLPLARCLITRPKGLSPQELLAYEVYDCLRNDSAASPPAACLQDGVLAHYENCSAGVSIILSELVGAENVNCSEVLRGPLSGLCELSFGDAVRAMCADPSLASQPGGAPSTSPSNTLASIGVSSIQVVAWYMYAASFLVCSWQM